MPLCSSMAQEDAARQEIEAGMHSRKADGINRAKAHSQIDNKDCWQEWRITGNGRYNGLV